MKLVYLALVIQQIKGNKIININQFNERVGTNLYFDRGDRILFDLLDW